MPSQDEVRVVLSLQDKFTAGMKSAKSSLADFGSSVKGAGSSISNFGSMFSTEIGLVTKSIKLAAVGVTGLGAAVTAAGVFALKSAADYEKSRMAFESILGSADAAKKKLKEVSDFAAKTPFELPDVVDAAKQLLAFGAPANDLVKKLTMIGDASAKMNVPMEQAIGVWARAKAGMFDIQEFAPLGVTRENLEKFGVQFKETGEVVDRSKLLPALEKMWSSEGTVGLMQRQSQTFSGIMSNLQDDIGRFARSVVGISDEGDIREGGAFFTLKNAASGLYDYLEQNRDTITRTVSDAVDGLTVKIREWVQQMGGPEGIKNKMMEFWNVLTTQIIPVIQQLISIVFEITKFVVEHKNTVLTLIATYEALKLVIWANGVVQAVSQLGSSIVALTAKVVTATGSTNLLSLALKAVPLSLVIAVGIGSILLAIEKARELKEALGEMEQSMANMNDTKTKTYNQLAQKRKDAYQSGDMDSYNKYNDQIQKLMKNWNPQNVQGRAVGGPVSGETPYMVGERGPELFVPNSSGTIIPNNKMGNITFDFRGAYITSKEQFIREIKEALSGDSRLASLGIR